MNNCLPELRYKLLLLIAGFVAVMLGLMIWVPHPDLTWHDQQRLGQIAILTPAMVALGLLRPSGEAFANPVWLWLAAGILLLGGASAALAWHPLWAAAEIALLVGSAGLGMLVFFLVGQFDDGADLALGVVLRLILAGLVFRFYVAFVSALAHADLFFTPSSLLDGFSNMRFEGQFLTMAVPLLGARLFIPEGAGIRYPRGLDIFLMVSLAGMVFVAGTRGTVAAWLAVAAVFWWLREGGRKVAQRMLLTMAAGLVLAWLVLRTVAWVTGQVAESRITGEQIFGLSAREILWGHAWAKVTEFPWLGVGPMHFASLGNPVGTHPHQALLQIASEWGLLVLLMVVTVVVTWLFKVFLETRSADTRKRAELRWALLFAVLSSMVQSMVDGVLVMPYPQLWLAIVVGWCSARCLPAFQGERVRIPFWLPLLLWGGANICLIAVAVMSYPDLVGAAEYCGGGPRFWCYGRI